MFRRLLVVFAALLGLASLAAAQVINEILYDTRGGDSADSVYTEIWGTPGTDLTGWTLVGINGNNGSEYRTVTLSGTIPSDGYFLIGNNANVWPVDQALNAGAGAGVDWQNAGSSTGADCDGVDLRDGDSGVVDHVCYGECATPGNCQGEGGTNAPDPFPSGGVDYAIARIPDHQDTDNNGTDWSVTETLTPGAPNSGVPCDPQYVELADIRENDGQGIPALNGVFVVVRGVVNVDNYTLDSLTESNFFIQDDNAGLNIFRGGVPTGIMAGDCVEVSGWVSSYNGLTEIVASGSGNCIFAVDSLNHVDPPTPITLTTTSFFEAFEGMLARIAHVTIVDGTWPAEGGFANLTISDGQGTMTLRIDSDTNIDGSPQPSQPFDVIGIITQFDNSAPYTEGYQITPRSISDFVTLAAGDPHPAAIGDYRLVGAYPNPFNSTAQVNFEVGTARDLTLRIFDLLGREVATQAFHNLTPGAHTYSWSPSGSTGLYFIRLESAANVQTAKALYLR